MKLSRPKICKNVDADLAISIVNGCMSDAALAESSLPLVCAFVFNGVHERTAKCDEILVDWTSQNSKKTMVKYVLKRDSLYHILPEYLFHPLDRYADCENDEDLFKQRRKEQKLAEENAILFFRLFDSLLMRKRIEFQNHLNTQVLQNNRFLSDFVTDGYKLNLKNRYIASVYPCITWLRAWRGYDDMLRRALDIAFAGAMDSCEIIEGEQYLPIDTSTCSIDLGSNIDDTFCGPVFCEGCRYIKVHCQMEITSGDMISHTELQIQEFIDFFSTWFLSMDSILYVDFQDKYMKPVLGIQNRSKSLYLNYNTQLI